MNNILQKLALISVIILASGAIIVWGSFQIKKKNEEIKPSALVYIPERDRLHNLIDSLSEDSVLKANLLVVLASEYSGEGEELNELLVTYAQFKLTEIENKKK